MRRTEHGAGGAVGAVWLVLVVAIGWAARSNFLGLLAFAVLTGAT